jgi:hypothetical protein
MNTVKQQHTSMATSILTTKSTYRSIQRLSERNVSPDRAGFSNDGIWKGRKQSLRTEPAHNCDATYSHPTEENKINQFREEATEQSSSITDYGHRVSEQTVTAITTDARYSAAQRRYLHTGTGTAYK